MLLLFGVFLRWSMIFKTDYLVTCPLQKMAQLDEEKSQLLFDVCCLWQYLRPKMISNFPHAVVEKYDQLFLKGILGWGEQRLWETQDVGALDLWNRSSQKRPGWRQPKIP